MNKRKISILYVITIAIILSGCPSPEIILSGENTLTAITVNDGNKDMVGNIAASTITFRDSAVAGTTQVTVKSILFSEKASANVNRNDMIPLNKTITITAENGSTKNYAMSINVSTATTTGNGMTTDTGNGMTTDTGNGMTTDTGNGMTTTGNTVIGTITGARLAIASITASGATLSGSFTKVNNPHLTELGILVTTNAMLNLELTNNNQAPTGAIKLSAPADQLALVNIPAFTVIPLSSFTIPNLTSFTTYYFRGYAAISGGNVAYTDKIQGMTLAAGIYTSIPDDNFRNAILRCINTNGTTTLDGQTSDAFSCTESFSGNNITANDNSIRTDVLRSITQFNYGFYNGKPDNMRIKSLSGVEQMVNLTILNVNTNSLSGGLSLAANTALEVLKVGDNSLTSIDVSANTALTILNVLNNDLRSLDVSQNTALDELHTGNFLSDAGNTSLTCIMVNDSQLEDPISTSRLNSNQTFSGSCITGG